MSSAYGLVRFPDGEVRAFIYHGTSDIAEPRLHATTEEAWDDRSWPPRDSAGPDEPVEIWTSYGGSFWWEGRATREGVPQITDGVAPHGTEDQMGREIDVRKEIHRGEPDWVSTWLRERDGTRATNEGDPQG